MANRRLFFTKSTSGSGFEIPTGEAVYALFELYGVAPAEIMYLGYIAEFAHRAVGLGAVPLYAAVVAGRFCDERRRLGDGVLYA